jgi:hypothetical protein
VSPITAGLVDFGSYAGFDCSKEMYNSSLSLNNCTLDSIDVLTTVEHGAVLTVVGYHAPECPDPSSPMFAQFVTTSFVSGECFPLTVGSQSVTLQGDGVVASLFTAAACEGPANVTRMPLGCSDNTFLGFESTKWFKGPVV